MDDDEQSLRDLLSSIFTSRTRLAPLIRVWLSNPVLFEKGTTRHEAWLRIFNFIRHRIRFRVSRDWIGVLDGPFPIPSGALTPTENRRIIALRERRIFGRIDKDPETHNNILTDCRLDARVDSVINRPAIIREFIRASFVLAGPETPDCAESFDFFYLFCRAQQTTMSDLTGVSDEFDAMRQILGLIFDGYGMQRSSAFGQKIAYSLCTGMPTIQQMRAFRDCLDGCSRLYIEQPTQQSFIAEFNRQMEAMRFSALTIHDEFDHSCLVIAVPDRKESKKEEEEPTPYKLEYVWYRRREFLAALMRIIFGEWIEKTVQQWTEIPRAIRHLLMSMQSVFAPTLKRLGRLDDKNSFQRLLMPFVDPDLYEKRVKAADIKRPGPDDMADPDAWRATVFFTTWYVLTYHPEAQQLPISTWASLLDQQLTHRNEPAIKMPPHLEQTYADIKAAANSLRALYHYGPDKCNLKIATLLDAFFSKTFAAALTTHLPITHQRLREQETPFMKVPRLGFTCTFQVITVEQARYALHTAHRGHEFLSARWKTSSHIGILFAPSTGVTLLDLFYTLSHRCNAKTWPAHSWRCFRLPQDNAVMAVVPADLFYDSIRMTYLRQRLTAYSTRTMECEWKTPDPEGQRDHWFQMLPLYPHLVQAFFSDNREMVYTAILGIISHTTWVFKKTLAISYSEISIATPQDQFFDWYYKLPLFLQAVTNPEHDTSRILRPYLQSFTSDFLEIDSRKGEVHGFKPDATCFVPALRNLLAINQVHRIACTTAKSLVLALDQIPEFKAAIEADKARGLNTEAKAYAILNQAIADGDDYKQTKGKDKVTDFHLGLRWPEHCYRDYPPHLALYDLILLPYLPTKVREIIFYGLHVTDAVLSNPDSQSSIGRNNTAQTFQKWNSRVDPLIKDAWTNPVCAAAAQFKPLSKSEHKFNFRPEVEKRTAEWQIMWQLCLILEYGSSCFHNLNIRDMIVENFAPGHEHAMEVLKAKTPGVCNSCRSSHKLLTRRCSKGCKYFICETCSETIHFYAHAQLDMKRVTYIVNPQINDCPYAILDNVPLRRHNQMLIFRNPISSKFGKLESLRPLFSPSDELLEFVIVHAPGLILTDTVDRRMQSTSASGFTGFDDFDRVNSEWADLELHGWKPAAFASTSTIMTSQTMQSGVETKVVETLPQASPRHSQPLPQPINVSSPSASSSPAASPLALLMLTPRQQQRKRKEPTPFQVKAAALAAAAASAAGTPTDKMHTPAAGTEDLRLAIKRQRQYWAPPTKAKL